MTTGIEITSETAWGAVLNKDRHYDGKFVYAAVTTRIYCRPSCPARNPQRRNTLIFWTAEEAERQGYVACLRCHPKSPMSAAENSIKTVLDYIEDHLDRALTLSTLSQVSGLSPHHLQETFKRIVGVSPKAFCDSRRIARFKQYLRAGQSIVNACYDVGFGSSRALYERTGKSLGMTPAAYKRGGKGVHIRYTVTSSKLGPVLISYVEQELCAVLLAEDDELLIRQLREEFTNADLSAEPSPKWEAAVLSCQDEDPMLLKLPINLRGRIFQARLWNILK